MLSQNTQEADDMNITRLIAGRDNWKDLAVKRRKEAESKGRQATKWKNRALKAEQELKEAREQARNLPVQTHIQPNITINIQIVCVFMFIFGAISCRAVSRILKFLQEIRQFNYHKVPCYGSVSNWVCRVGLGLLKGVEKWSDKKWIAIIDASIVYAGKKALVFLRIPLDHFLNNPHAPTLKDVECIGIKLGQTWNCQTVKEALDDVFAVAGTPIAILKDGAYDLAKGVEIWAAENNNIFEIADIGHVVANELKKLYGKNSVFQLFLEKVNSCCKRMFQTEIAFLRPPKIRTKGRFQNIVHVIDWAEKILSLLKSPGKAKTGSLVARLRLVLPGFSKLKVFVSRFHRDCMIVNEFMAELKNNGLNQNTYKTAKKILLKFPKRNSLRENLFFWLAQQMRIQCHLKMGQTPLLISSDCIESLMGHIKFVIERNPVQEFGRMVLATPLFCGSLSQEKIQDCLNKVSHRDFQNWQQEQIQDSVRRKRNAVFNRPTTKRAVQDPPIAEVA